MGGALAFVTAAGGLAAAGIITWGDGTMKVLFLDFDGVLNSEAFFRANRNQYGAGKLDEAAVGRLNAIVARTGASVVVSSTWRLGFAREELQSILARHGFSGTVIGVTPHLEHPEIDGVRVAGRVPRGREIQAWIDAQAAAPEAVAILDDDEEMEHLEDRLVRTTFEAGLCDEHVEAVVAILGGATP